MAAAALGDEASGDPIYGESAGAQDVSLLLAAIYLAGGLAVADGMLYIADTLSHRLRVVDLATDGTLAPPADPQLVALPEQYRLPYAANGVPRPMDSFYGMIENIDTNFGRLMKALEVMLKPAEDTHSI